MWSGDLGLRIRGVMLMDFGASAGAGTLLEVCFECGHLVASRREVEALL